ncbi:MAG: MFS transporter [Gammaproteobacteria bacterium]
MIEHNKIDVNGWHCIISIALLAAVVPAAVVLGPIVVGAYVTQLGFSEQQAGYLIAAELVGAGLATFVAYFAVSRFSWHRILYFALTACLLGNLLSAFLVEYNLLVPVRFVTGLAVGSIMIMTIVIVGMTRDQERNFGYWAMGQVIFAVIGFAVLPHLIPKFGIGSFFIGMAIVMVLLLLFVVKNLPASGTAQHQLGLGGLPPAAKQLAPVSLLALLLFYIGIGSVWAYVERIGAQAGLAPDFIGYVLSGSSVVGVLGASLATFLSTRFGRLLPPLFGYLMIGVTIAMYFGTPTALIFAVASLLFKFAWWFISPYLLANMTSLDPSGRIAILTNFVIGVGLGFGPAIAAWLLGPEAETTSGNLDYSKVIYLGVSCVSLSIVLLIPIIRYNSGSERVGSASDI